ncbi:MULTISPECIES: DUF6331 family protein [Gammaproteobacteria]|jgi:hypothetical protein|uniref:DUF6331 family protein n=1 Tax=Gammaproteobacteria TaxID=1236 RepID=UPI001F064F10|nr:DUF6331 family protein [Rheinheimera hassiensis]
MSHDEHKNDIRIGENEWIAFIDLSGRYESAINIDHIIHKTSDLWNSLETECVAGCCGIDAFSFYPKDIISAISENDNSQLGALIQETINEIECLPTTVVVSNRLNNYEDKAVFIALLNHLLKVITSTNEHA